MKGGKFEDRKLARVVAVALLIACVALPIACGNDGKLVVAPPGQVSPVPTATSIPGGE